MSTPLLIAETEGTLTPLLQQFSSSLGYDVETASGGLECLSKLRQTPFQLVVLDSELPWGGADGVLAIMRDEPRLAQIPVILITTAACPNLKPPLLHVLSRPFSAAALFEAIRALVAANPKPSVNQGPEDLAADPQA